MGDYTEILRKKKEAETTRIAQSRTSPGNKIPEEKMNLVRDHISSLPSSKISLSPNFNVRSMYNLYPEACAWEEMSSL